MFNLAIRWKLRADNPASTFLRNPEQPRERFLDLKEIARLSEVRNHHPNRRGVNIVRMLMLTGARHGEALNARWERFEGAAVNGPTMNDGNAARWSRDRAGISSSGQNHGSL